MDTPNTTQQLYKVLSSQHRQSMGIVRDLCYVNEEWHARVSDAVEQLKVIEESYNRKGIIGVAICAAILGAMYLECRRKISK